MTTHAGPIVVGADGGLTDSAAVRWAAVLAQRTGAPLIVVHASEPEALAARAAVAGATDITLLLEAEEEGNQQLSDEVDVMGNNLGIEVTYVTRRGSAGKALLEYQHEASVIVVGTGRKGLISEFVLGTTSLAVAAHSDCPVAVINPEVQVEALTHNRIGVGIDGSRDSQAAAMAALQFAETVGAGVVAVSTWYIETIDGYLVTEPDSPEWHQLQERKRATLERALAPAREAHPDVQVELAVRRGPVIGTLQEMSKEWDLVVVGSRGLGGIQGRLLGSVSQRLMRTATVPVLVCTLPKGVAVDA